MVPLLQPGEPAGVLGAQSLQDSWRAALEGDLVTVQSLIERGNSPDTSDAEGSTLLMLAARGGHAPVVEYLISRKASVNGRNKFGDTALMAAAMGGLDALVFTGGVGERAPAIRAAAAEGLGFLGIEIDPSANRSAEGDADISAADALVRALVITSREDLEIARQTREALE